MSYSAKNHNCLNLPEIGTAWLEATQFAGCQFHRYSHSVVEKTIIESGIFNIKNKVSGIEKRFKKIYMRRCEQYITAAKTTANYHHKNMMIDLRT